jgi:hypothetical protein
MHNLAIDNNLMCTDSVLHSISWVGAGSDLNFAPLLVGWDKLPLGSEILEFSVDTLFLDTSLSLDER